MSRAFERMEGESAKAYRAFQTFRDLGADRSLAKATELVYGSTANVRQLSRWSSRFNWAERVRAYDDWAAMLAARAIEEHLREQAEDHAQREVALREKALSLREKAAEQAATMLSWPLSERRLVQEAEDGEQASYLVLPARWSKQTAVSLYGMVVGGAPERPEDLDEYDVDLSEFSEEELEEYLHLEGKVRYRPKEPPEG